jgi:hypothetical protein
MDYQSDHPSKFSRHFEHSGLSVVALFLPDLGIFLLPVATSPEWVTCPFSTSPHQA